MFCKYCGKSIDDDSNYCSYCGRQIVEKTKTLKSLSALGLLVRKNSEPCSFARIRITKEHLFKILNFLWKLIKTIVFVIGGSFAYILLGLFMAPFIALFNAEIPSLGYIDEIRKIWKKEKDNEDGIAE